MKTTFLLILLVQFFFTKAQVNGSVKGVLVNSTAGQPLANATVSVLRTGDSSFIGYTLSDKKGSFEIKKLDTGHYMLIVSYNGYEDLDQIFAVSNDKKFIDIGVMVLQPAYKTLSAVVVSDAAPVRINGDTISFKADAFTTPPHATVEDLLKKLPGIQVQKDGAVSAMGETVQKVYVDGKEFFGNDPRLATKNITADMVDQVQVFDDMSEQAKFTKIDDGSRSKTINIKLKKDRKKGDFGTVTAGGGTGGRYEGNLSFNHFRDAQRISVVATGNNTNKLSYTFNGNASGGSTTQFSQGSGGFSASGMNTIAGGAGNSSGINSARSTGINYNDQWGSKVDFSSSYNFSQSDYRLDQFSFKKYSFPGDSTSEVNTQSETNNSNKSHRVSARLEYAIDSFTSVLYTANLSVQRSNNLYTDTSFTVSRAINEYLAITGKADKKDKKNSLNYGGELLYRRKFRVPGRTFTLGWRNGYNESSSENKVYTPVTTYDPSGSILNLINPDLQNRQETPYHNNTVSASYTEPVGNKKILEFNYAHSGSKNISDKKAFDFNSISGKYDLVNFFQTNYFKYTSISNRIGTNFRLQKKNYNYQLGLAVQLSELKNQNKQAVSGKDTTISQRFTNFFPTASFNFTISRSKSIRFYYRGRTNAPNVTQLQDVQDISNPLQVRTGNPLLKQEFINNFSLNYNTFNMQASRFFSANLNFNTTGNKIVNSIDSIGTAVIITKPVNSNGAYNASGQFTLGFPIKKWKGSNVNITTMGYYSRDISLVYKMKNFTTMLMINQSFSFNYTKERFDLGIAGSFVYNHVKYDLQKSSNTGYFRQSWSADFSYRFKKFFFLLTDLDYFINSGRTQGFNKDALLWNIAIAKQFLKNKAAEVKLTAYDIMKQNKGINRNTGDNYFEDTRSDVVPRFFLLSITYNLKQLSRKQKTSQPESPMMIFSN